MSTVQEDFFLTENIKNHIKEFAEFDLLLNEELFALRRSIGFYWLGKPEIIEYENNHAYEKQKINNILSSKYNTSDELIKILLEYTTNNPIDRIFKFSSTYKYINKDNLTENELTKFNILKEFVDVYSNYNNIFDKTYGVCCTIEICKNLLKKFRDAIYEKKSLEKKQIKYDLLEECAICMNSFNSCHIDSITNCNHQFHKSCITLWINTSNSCPVCRHISPKIFDVLIS